MSFYALPPNIVDKGIVFWAGRPPHSSIL